MLVLIELSKPTLTCTGGLYVSGLLSQASCIVPMAAGQLYTQQQVKELRKRLTHGLVKEPKAPQNSAIGAGVAAVEGVLVVDMAGGCNRLIRCGCPGLWAGMCQSKGKDQPS